MLKQNIELSGCEGLSVIEACAVSGIGRNGLYAAVNSGKLKARKYGKRTIILRNDLAEFLSALPVSEPSPVAA